MSKLVELVRQLRNGERSIEDYLAELEARFVEWEPVIFSFVPEPRRWERVAREAAAIAARWPDPAQRPPLYGVPVGIKDIYHVDGLPTRGGSRLPADRLTGPESVAVSQLKAAGALILGKTVTTEFAYFGPSPARNPHNPFHTPGGSSSGSAAAVGAGLCPVALGSQTIGSVNRPAAFCGAVGYKPTYDRISKEHVLELAHSHDHVGTFTHDVGGTALIASVLCANWSAPVQKSADSITLGIPDGPYMDETEPDARKHFENTCQQLAAAGITIKKVDAMANFAEIRRQHLVINDGDAARYHAQFADLHPLYHQKTRDLIASGQRYTDADLAAGMQAKADLRQTLHTLMDAHGLDALITPPAPGPAPVGYASTGNPIMQLPFTNAGLPMLNMPSGSAANGLPLGIQLVGRADNDETLFAIGPAIERILDVSYSL